MIQLHKKDKRSRSPRFTFDFVDIVFAVVTERGHDISENEEEKVSRQGLPARSLGLSGSGGGGD